MAHLLTRQRKPHYCLEIREILDNIFGYLVPYNYRGHGLGTLAALARTCKTFSEPALDILWYSQDSVVPLISCLPSDALSFAPISEMLRPVLVS